MTPEEQAQLDAMQKEDEGAPPEPKAPEVPAPKPITPDNNKLEFEGKTYLREEAVLAARRENDELKKQMLSLQGIVSEGDKKLQQLFDGIKSKAEAGPTFEEDPGRHLKHENESLKKQLQEVSERINKQDAGTQEQTRITQFAAQVSAKEAAFVKTTPDYFEASKFVQEAWADEFKEAGFDEDKIPQLVFQKSLGVTYQATQKQKDPAEAVYRIAKRLGFKAAEVKGDAELKLAALAKGQEASKTNTGGGAPQDEPTFAALAQMDSAAIDKLVNDPAWWNKHIRNSPLQ